MSVRHVHFNKFVSIFTLIAGTAPMVTTFAATTGSPLNFFEGRDLDYWNEGNKTRPFVPLRNPHVESTDTETFEWSRYEDPKNDEFWEDAGKYLPPRPFREAAANPSPENIERYVRWQARKIELVTKFHEALARSPPAQESNGGAKRTIRARDSPIQTAAEFDWRQLDLIYFYQTSCTHCRSSKAVVEELRQRGVRVSFVQLDADKNPPLHASSTPYTKTLDEQFNVQVTPTWAFRRRGKTETLTGATTLSQLKDSLSPLFNKD